MFFSSVQNLLLPASLIGFCLGIGTSRYFLAVPGRVPLFLLFLLSSLLCWLALRTSRFKEKRVLFAIGFLFFFAGILRLPHQDLSPPPHHAYYLFPEARKMAFTAQVTRFPVVKGDILQFEARLLDILTPEKRERTFGLVRLSMPATVENISLPPGRMFMARGKISRIVTFRNPGAFDYNRYLAEKGLYLKGWIDSPANLHTIEALPAAGLWQTLVLIPERIRYHIHRFLNKSLTPLPAALYSAILIGDRSSIPPAVVENFKAAGAMHLLAISGLHVGMLAFFCLLFFSLVLRRFPSLLHRYSLWKLVTGLTLFPLFMYALIAGFQPPVVRSLLMFAVLTVAILANRLPDLPNSIMLAALLILAISPQSLFAVSFQLTFTAVFAIVLFTRHVYPGHRSSSTDPGTSEKMPLVRRLRLLVLLSVACSVAASLGTAPLILYHFSRISLISPLSSLLLGPLFCFIALPLGFAACLVLPFYQPLAHLFLQLGGATLLLSAKICAFLARFTFADLYLPPPGLLQILLSYCLLLALIFSKKERLYKRAALVFFPLLVGTTFLPHTIPDAGGNKTEAKVVFFDVGQGSAAVLHLPHNNTFVIDGGSDQRNGLDIGRTIIGPYLLRNNIRHLEGIVLTHPHADHFNGLFFLLEKFRPDKLWVNVGGSANAEFKRLLAAARKVHTDICLPESTGMLRCIGEYTLSAMNTAVLLRKAGEQAPHGVQVNDGLVVKLSRPGEALLFPGDIGRETEGVLAAALPSFVKANVLLASHHGSSGSNSRAFLTAVDPACIVVSTIRREDSLGQRVLANTDRAKPPLLLTTAHDGAVTVVLTGKVIKVSAEGKDNFGGRQHKSWLLPL